MSSATHRTVRSLHPARRDDIADLVTHRPLPAPGLEQLDPFLFLNHHGPQSYRPGNRGLPFGPHPHRGFETVTFILDGELAHSDSGGHESVIRAGGVQWMTAGRGLVHAELSPESFKRSGGPLEILQLWVNLPGRLKMTAPRYVGLQRDGIPEFELTGGGRLALIAGRWNAHDGPIKSLTGLFMSTLALPAGSSARFDGTTVRTVFLYVVRGLVRVGDVQVAAFNLAELGPGDIVEITATVDSVLRFGHGAPLEEPLVAHGPFVMNTRAEIMQAIQDYQAGLFDQPAG